MTKKLTYEELEQRVKELDKESLKHMRVEELLKQRTYDLGERIKELNCLYDISKLIETSGISLDEIVQGVVELIPSSCQYPEITCSRIILDRKEYKTKSFSETVWKQASNILAHYKSIGTLEVCYLKERPEMDEGPFLKEEKSLINAIAERLGHILERKRSEDALQKSHEALETRVKERTVELVTANERLLQEIKGRRQVEEELKESSEKIKLFAYSILHDLKSPIFAIYGLTELLKKKYGDILDDKGKNYCVQILKASEQIAELIEQINVYISTKETPLSIEPVKIKEILQIVRDEFSVQINLRQIKWIEPESIPEIFADRLSIIRILRNFIDNSFKYGGDNLDEIKIEYREFHDFHILSVSDDGVGMNVEDFNKIFEQFKRHGTSRGVEGVGLGLAIVKEIAEQHGGNVWVESWPEKGSIFNISISKDLQLSH
ncbi:MAG: hypothetical protein JRI86_13970 [Deltaproteobacteria bacterium]|nr:hypothetical protein [Deltaproteobacteria bacterium]